MPTNRNCPLKHCQLPNPNCHKARRIKAVIEDEPLMEFGTRRAQEMDAAIWGLEQPLLVEHLRLPMFELAKSSASLSLVPMPTPWFKHTEMITRLSKPTLKPIMTVSSSLIPMIRFVLVFQQPSRLPKKWEIRLTSKGFGLIQAIWPIFPRKFVSN